MAFTGNPSSLPPFICFSKKPPGYVFENAEAITPYLEHPRTGITSQFCSELAQKLKCYVVAGFPEKLSPEEKTTNIEQVGANSAVLYGPDGEWVGGYRKTHLYKTDLTWAKPGKPIQISLSTYLSHLSLSLPRHRFRHFHSTIAFTNRNSRYMHGSQPSNTRLDICTRSLRTR